MNILNNKYLSQITGGCSCLCFETKGGHIAPAYRGMTNNSFICIKRCLKKGLHYLDCNEADVGFRSINQHDSCVFNNAIMLDGFEPQ